MAVPPHGYLPYNKVIPAGNETALMFAARVGDLDSAKLLVAAGAHVNDADAWGVSATSLAAHSGYGELVEFLLDKGADPNAAVPGFTALHEAIMRRDETDGERAARTWRRRERSAPNVDADAPVVSRSQFRPRVRRRDTLLAGRPFHRTGRHAPAGEARRRPAVRPPRRKSCRGKSRRRISTRLETTTALMAATGMGGGSEAWVPLERGQREALTLEAVKLAVELGVDVNAANTDGRTALDAAKTLKYDSVVSFLVEKGAKPGTKKGPALPAARDKDDPRAPQ